jgi:hypothetical protein
MYAPSLDSSVRYAEAAIPPYGHAVVSQSSEQLPQPAFSVVPQASAQWQGYGQNTQQGHQSWQPPFDSMTPQQPEIQVSYPAADWSTSSLSSNASTYPSSHTTKGALHLSGTTSMSYLPYDSGGVPRTAPDAHDQQHGYIRYGAPLDQSSNAPQVFPQTAASSTYDETAIYAQQGYPQYAQQTPRAPVAVYENWYYNVPDAGSKPSSGDVLEAPTPEQAPVATREVTPPYIGGPVAPPAAASSSGHNMANSLEAVPPSSTSMPKPEYVRTLVGPLAANPTRLLDENDVCYHSSSDLVLSCSQRNV